MGRLSGLDVAFLCLESRTRPMHMGAMAVFQAARPVDHALLRSVLAERAARIPALCRRLEPTRFPPGGAPLCEVYPFAPLAPGQAVSIGIATYQDAVHIGLQTDRDAVPDTDVLASAIVKSGTTLHELCA